MILTLEVQLKKIDLMRMERQYVPTAIYCIGNFLSLRFEIWLPRQYIQEGEDLHAVPPYDQCSVLSLEKRQNFRREKAMAKS